MVDTTLHTVLAYFENGFTPVRIEPGQKMPKSQGWQTDVPTADKLHRAFARPSNVGIRLGDALPDGTYLIAIDIDLEEMDLIRCVERAIGEKVPCKRGKKGYTYFVRIDREVKTHKINWVRDGQKKAAIDVLARGAQTVVPPSIHPETGQPYYWVSGEPLDQIHVRQIPVFSDVLLDEIKGFCKNPEDAISQLNDMEWRGVGGGGNTHDICLVAVSSMVARNWTDADIHDRILRAKREACEVAGTPFNWPEAQHVIQEWIDSSRDKKFDTTTKHRKSDVPLDILNRYVYVIELDRMLDREKGSLLNMHVFNNVHARDMPKPWSMMMTSPDLVFVDKLTYAPGQPKLCKEKSFHSEAILDCFNMYYGPSLEPEEGNVDPWVQLVKDFCDNVPEAYDHVFSFFAHLVQYPGERMNHALVFQGEQGIGKDSIALAMNKILGQQNTGIVTLSQIESQFNAWLFGKQLIVYSELLAAGRRGIYNKLKNTITDEVLEINTKHLAVQRVPNRANYIFVTNYKHSLSIDASDRRLWVWYSSMKKKGADYYDRYYQWLADTRSGNHLLHWLLQYDTSKWNPKAPPPMTDAKRSLIRASASEVEQFLREAEEARTWPMTYDVVSVNHLLSALRPFMRVSSSMISEALDNICGEGTDLPVRPAFGAKRPRMRVVRNFEYWRNADPKEVAKYYRMPVPPQAGESEGGYMVYKGEDIGPGAPGSPQPRDDF